MSGNPTNQGLETELISVVSQFEFAPCGALSIWLPKIEERSDGDDDSKTDQQPAKHEIVSECDPPPSGSHKCKGCKYRRPVGLPLHAEHDTPAGWLRCSDCRLINALTGKVWQSDAI
jgi:hypothetical protein